MPRAYRLIPVAERIWDKVEKTKTCWLWTGSQQGGGYGKIRSDGRSLMAHRVAYESLVGPIPSGKHLHHLCRNRLCVNPDHLEPVTNAENVRYRLDRIEALEDALWEITGTREAGPVARRIAGRALGLNSPGAIHVRESRPGRDTKEGSPHHHGRTTE